MGEKAIKVRWPFRKEMLHMVSKKAEERILRSAVVRED